MLSRGLLAAVAAGVLVLTACEPVAAPPAPSPAPSPALSPALSPAASSVAPGPPVPALSPTRATPVPARPAPSAAPRPVPSGTPRRALVTFYAAFDNDPPGSTAIAYPRARRRAAGGTGTYDDPLTLASDPRELRPGTRVYVPAVQRYYVMEDDCAACIEDWSAARTAHVDLWLSASTDRAVLACENRLTPDGPVEILVDPARGLAVDPRPLFAGGRCAR